MARLLANLQGPVGIDPYRYHIDAGFTFGCATTCGGDCSVQPGQTLVNLGAKWLGYYIQQQRPPGNIILIGYSMGGLVARDLIANNYYGVLTGHPVKALITLGTPNLGYPKSSIDELIMCKQLILDMSGAWSYIAPNWYQVSSQYLDSLRNQWVYASFTGYWMAAAGEHCSHTPRNASAPGEGLLGCRSTAPISDDVVCRDSALYGTGEPGQVLNYGPMPVVPWYDERHIYVHTDTWGTQGILCGNSNDPSQNPQLFDPPIDGALFLQIKAVINAR
jgi:pimeloyl-ACP methyl ester carboxylesterase